MMLITGAAGKTGRALLKALSDHGEPVRAMIRHPDQASELEALGASECVVADLLDRAGVDRACQGVRAVYHIPPNMHPDEATIAESLIRCAESRSVQRLVYHSVLHPQIEEMPHHWHKMQVEARLFRSRLEWTILQPAVYMQNLLVQWETILTRQVYRVPYAIEARLSYLDLQDLAEVAVRCLVQEGHAFAVYELAGTAPIAQVEVASMLSGILKMEVRAEEQSLQAWKKEALETGLGLEKINSLVGMFRYYSQHGLQGNSRVCGWLLDRQPTSMRQFLHRQVSSAYA